jgi:hypothetical protein
MAEAEVPFRRRLVIAGMNELVLELNILHEFILVHGALDVG